MTEIRVLHDVDTDEPFYPISHEQAIIDDNGEVVIPKIKEELKDAKVGYDGTVYESAGEAVRGQIGDLATNIVLVQAIDFSDSITGKYIDLYGSDADSSNFSRTNPFNVKKGGTIKIKCVGYQTNVAIISKYYEGTFIPLVICMDGALRDYSFTATEDMDIVVSYRNLSEYSGIIRYDKIHKEIDFIKKDIEEVKSSIFAREVTNNFLDESTYIKDCYINSSGLLSELKLWIYTKPFFLEKGCKLTVTGRGSGTNVAIISEYISEENKYIPLVISSDSEIRDYEYVAEKDMYIVVSLTTQSTHFFKYETRELADKVDKISKDVYNISQNTQSNTMQISKNAEEIENIHQKLSFDYTKILKNMVGIGDSLMSGEIYDKDNSIHKDCYNSSWLSFLSKYNNAKWCCYSNGGLTTKSWLESRWKTEFESLSELPDAVFIALGTNDKNIQESLPMGSSSDTSETITFCGLYKKIIDIAHEKAPGAKIFCCSLYGNTNSTEVTYSNLILEVSEQYNYCYFIDIANNITISRNANDIYAEDSHFSTIGYLVVADLVHNLVNKSIKENLSDYKYFGLYNE